MIQFRAFNFETFHTLYEVGLIPNVVFEGHLAAAILGLLAFIALQVVLISNLDWASIVSTLAI